MSDDDAREGELPPVARYLLYAVLAIVLITVFVVVGVYGA